MLQSAYNPISPFQKPPHQQSAYLFNPGLSSSHFQRTVPRSQSNSPSFQLPRTLERPPFKEVPRFNIELLAPDLSAVPPEYSRRNMRAQIPHMIQGLQALSTSHVPPTLPQSQIPKIRSLTIPLRCAVPASTLPTHIFAFSSSKSKSSSVDAHLFPVHALILALNCSALPRIPSFTPKISSAHTVTLPVVSVTLPSPAYFPVIQNFLYTHDAATLLTELLGSKIAVPTSFVSKLNTSALSSTVRSTLASGQKLHQLSGYLTDAVGGDLQLLMGRATAIVGVWRNLVALGVVDSDIWDVLDLAYEILLGSINLSAGV